MRVVRINHERCHEYSDTSYVCVADGVDDDTVLGFCTTARDACLAAEREAKKKSPPYPQEPRLATLPQETTVGAALNHYQQIKATYDDWQKKQRAASQTFEEWLYKVSDGKIVSLYAGTEASDPIDLSWGHNHGSKVRYGTERIWPKDDSL